MRRAGETWRGIESGITERPRLIAQRTAPMCLRDAIRPATFDPHTKLRALPEAPLD